MSFNKNVKVVFNMDMLEKNHFVEHNFLLVRSMKTISEDVSCQR